MNPFPRNRFLAAVWEKRETERLEKLRDEALRESDVFHEHTNDRELNMLAAAQRGTGKLTPEQLAQLGKRHGRGRPIPQSTAEQLVADFKADPSLTYAELGRRYEMTDMTVRNYIKRAGLKLECRKNGRGLTDEQRAQLVEDFKKDTTQKYSDLGRKYSISLRAVQHVLKNAGVTLQRRNLFNNKVSTWLR